MAEARLRGTTVAVVNETDLARRVRQERARGTEILEGFGPGPELRHGANCLRVGTISDAAGAQAAVDAAARGESLVVAVTLTGADRRRVLEDLGNVARLVTEPIEAATRHDEADDALLARIALGATVADAARAVGMSTRSAYRRLAAMRAETGAHSTAELVAARSTGTVEPTAGAGVESNGVVGRADELAQLEAHLLASRSIAVVGEGGVGKTTLLRSATAAVADRRLHGGALATFRSEPFFPLIRAAGSVPAGADAAGVLQHVVEAVGSGILVLDDLHWSDPATLALLPQLATRVTLVAGVRTGEPGTAAAMEALDRGGVTTLRLGGLPPTTARALVAVAHPDLARAEVDTLIARAGGNPLLLLELGADGSPTLEASLLGRLEHLDVDAQDALVRLSLLGRPAGPELLGPGTVSLLDVGLACRIGELVDVRHHLVAEEVVGSLDAAARRRAHAALAPLLEPREAAAHWYAAEDVDRARESAISAAAHAPFPNDRARFLLLAAQCGPPPGADDDGSSFVDLLIEIVDALLEAGDVEGAGQALARVDDGQASPAVALRRARLCWAAGDPEGARAAVDAGLDATTPVDPAVEVALRIEQLRYPIRVDFDPHESERLATETWELARAVGEDETRALTLLGSARLVAGSTDWEAPIEDAIRRARRAGEVDAGFEASNALVAAHLFAGDRSVARAAAQSAAERARVLRRRRWEEQFAVTANLLDLLAGGAVEVAEWGREFVTPHLTTAAQLAYGVYAIALADLGRGREALRVLADCGRLDVGDETGKSLLAWAAAETHWLAGRPEAALAAADECLAVGAERFPVRPLAGVLRAWASVDLGIEPVAIEGDGWDFARAAAFESAGIVALESGDLEQARSAFSEAAALAADTPRYACRASWGLGEALRRDGELDAAIRAFDSAVSTATACGLEPLAGRIRRSLRGAGVSVPVAPAANGELTRRQSEVLRLVAEGHTSGEVAAILGVSVATVETHVRAAMQRLGATNRRQAVALAFGRS